MLIKFDPDKDSKESSSDDLLEIEQKIEIIKNSLESELPLFFKMFESYKNYFEISLPFFENGITITISKLREKFLIGVWDHKNLFFYGNLLVEGFPCISIQETKELRSWKTWDKEGLSIFKSDQ